MSDAYASERFREALHIFQALEAKLRKNLQGVEGKEIEAVLIDLRAAIPGLDGEELGRALVFKAYVTLWLNTTEMVKRRRFLYDPSAPVAPRLIEALGDARRGRGLLRDGDDTKWADATIEKLEGYAQRDGTG